MKKSIFLTVTLALTLGALNAQTKKDGTPDMRYKANKDLYSSPSISEPNYYDSHQERNYNNGGQIILQDGYMRSNGTYVAPHLKTTPDNYNWNNLNTWSPR